MHKRMMQIGMVGVVIVLAFGAIGSAAAQGPDGPRTRVAMALLRAVADATNQTVWGVLHDLRAGETLDDILVGAGVDPQTVIDSVTADLTADIEQVVADGRIDQDQADRLLAELDEALERALKLPLPRRWLPVLDRLAEAVDHTLVATVAELAGMDARDVIAEWRDAESLAAVVEAHGLTVEAVLDATEAAINEDVNQRVADGRITDEQAALILDGVRERLEARLNSPFPSAGVLRERIQDGLEQTLIGVLAEMAGVDVRDVLRDALMPPTLAEIAAGYDLEPATIIAETETRVTAAVNERVASGQLTQERADALLAGLHDRLEDRFNAPFRPDGLRGRHGMWRGRFGGIGPRSMW